MIIKGRVWKYGDNIDTDQIIPTQYLTLTTIAEMAKYAMEPTDINFAKEVKSGDIISIDIGAIVNDYVGDAAVTLPVGEIDEEIQRLLDVTQEALNQGIEKAIVDNRLSDISNAIQTFVEKNNFY